MHENPIIKHSILKMFYNRVFEHLNVLFKGLRSIEVLNRVFMHIHSRDKSLSQTFCFILENPPYTYLPFMTHNNESLESN